MDTNVNQRPVNLALVGCGNLGARHAGNLTRMPGVTLSAFIDRDLDRATALRDRLDLSQARVAEDIAVVLDDRRCDGVLIATHHDSHPSLAIAAARAGKHIFVEKPLALDEAACREVEAAVGASGVQLVMGFQARKAPFTRRALQWIPQPRILVGTLIAGRWGDQAWAQQPDVGGGNVLSQGVHAFDLLSHAAGAAPRVIFAEGGTLTHDPSTTSVIDSVLCTIQFANGALGTLAVGDFGPSPWTQMGFYEFFDGRGKSATLHHFFEGLSLGTEGARALPFGPEREPAIELGLADLEPEERADPYGYAAVTAEFVGCVRSGCPPPFAADVRDGRRATAAVQAAFESIRRGFPITVED